MEEATKKAFFQDLYRLDEESEDDNLDDDAVLISSRHDSAVSSSRDRVEMPHNATSHHAPVVLKHTVSTPLLRPPTSLIPRTIRSASQTFPSTSQIGCSVNRPIGAADVLNKTRQHRATPTVSKGGKRKRGRSAEARSDSQQVFKGLSFFFFPNNDVAPARKLRIRKAMEFGALWVRDWREGVTHLVVDKGLCYRNILDYLHLTSLPANVIVVNEHYPPSCIRYHFGDFSVSADPQHYRVEGHESAVVAQRSATQSSEGSLQLKPDRAKLLPPPLTPSVIESSEDKGSAAVRQDHANDATELNSCGVPEQDPSNPKNALEEAIEEARAVQYLPLDVGEEDDTINKIASDVFEGEDSEGDRGAQKNVRKGPVDKDWQQSFTCMSKHDGKNKDNNLNNTTIEILQEMANYYERHQDHWRFTAYRKAIGALRNHSSKVTNAKEALQIPCIGQRLADKIEEIVWTKRHRRLENTNSDPLDEVFQQFMNIYGVGLKQATQWIDQGHRTFDDLINKASLSKNQKIGIEHFADFQTRIPRSEMERHNRYVCETCSTIDVSVQFTIGGSYRRGAADSGDVDFIVTKAGSSIEVLRRIVLGTLIPQLFQAGYLKVGLATSDEESGSKWHGAAALPNEQIWRRIDFLFVPWEEFGAALIYFTGNDIFNRSIRLLASKQGMRLNQHGLWRDVMRGGKRKRITQGSLVEAKDERKIFEILGVPWRPPHHRVC